MKAPTSKQRLEARERPRYSTILMYQRWRDLLFLHWEFDSEVIQKTLPEGLKVDTYEGKAYIGVVPFFMQDVRPPVLPAVPGFSDFLELNVRTYVHDRHGIPGVWFYSLDANNWLAVQGAWFVFSLPYYYASMTAKVNDKSGEIDYQSHREGASASFKTHFKYSPASATRHAPIDSLEFFLVERYYLFTYSNWSKQLYRLKVHHVPYPILDCEVSQYDANMIGINKLPQPERRFDHARMSPGVNVETFGLEVVE